MESQGQLRPSSARLGHSRRQSGRSMTCLLLIIFDGTLSAALRIRTRNFRQPKLPRRPTSDAVAV